MKAHPIAGLFPLLEGAAFDALVADIKEHGQRDPIWLLGDTILDGRNRERACKVAKVEPKTRAFRGSEEEALFFVLSTNLHRRHLNESQRAMVAVAVEELLAKNAKKRQGRRTDLEPSGKSATKSEDTGKARTKAAEAMNVSPRLVQDAKKISTSETVVPEVIAAVTQGKLAVTAAAKLVGKSADEQRAIVAHVEAGDSPQEAKRKVTAGKIAAAGKLPNSKFRVVYADPPWDYGNSMPPGTTVPRDYYPSMKLQEICDLPIAAMIEDNAVLFLWTTSPHLEEAFEVIRAWGFKYKSSFVWDKVKHNMGHYNSVRHELLLVCVRGSCQPDVRKLFDSVVTEERTEHSRKPEKFREIIDTIYPHGKRVELFRRGGRIGEWDTWGNEAANAAE